VRIEKKMDRIKEDIIKKIPSSFDIIWDLKNFEE
jgi:hypothetical protein